MSERIIDVYWEGPFKWGEHGDNIERCHVLYAIYGTHPVYGYNMLLYIGKTESVSNRMMVHADWIEDEYDVVSIRVASMGDISKIKWEGWRENERYEKADARDVSEVETLLIYVHQPAYNQISKDSLRSAVGLRVFNTGRIGSILPEVSYRYHNPNGEW